jgi:2-dehydro-3-deoxygluconokinase
MTRDFDILAIGEPLFELAERADGNFAPGFGGDTSNCLIAAARLGARTAYLSKIGADPFGDALSQLWRREAVDATLVARHPSAPTGIYFVMRRGVGHEFIYRRQGSAASLLDADDISAQTIARTRALHVSGISQAISENAQNAVERAIDLAKSAGVLVSYDTNFRERLWSVEKAKETMRRTLARADIALPSIEDMNAVFGIGGTDEAIDFCLGQGASIVALTLGREGVAVADKTRRVRVPATPVVAIDTTGAGDAFDGAFLAEYLRGRDWIAAARFACVAASLSTEKLGAVPGLATREQIEGRLSGADVE